MTDIIHELIKPPRPDSIDINASLQNDYGFDSVSIIELILALETEFSLEFPDSELIIEKYENVNQVANIIARIYQSKGRSMEVK
ncbi:acyl carrier protein [Paenibacillus lutimineralis]|uniref:acyl carrier protein n=1 Tax=Paenibacillus lutimineralis TaxID=2707005 RepID=UPI0013A65CF2|nr:acyl carrier protein [Paenibacillus lutimineralis]